MTDETTYVSPTLIEVGDFAELTLGNGGGGVDTFWECWFWCDRP
ncbi:lasso RiPP family leader peptide-containing protein [Cryptosporangium aurantiacum]|uniref:Lasso RiPP family leader peptide-containing protein n=1 Tax=Cryptosporangium aurantiacum TaxID=134849 RepID=A0A1M7RNX3_9ACTN|nr:lasso RiPP family leader peptide-containing protein [Cryptosporangium aurantiacum]SHN47901.1 hypothetical protein SAMN05443668_1304 [Cryptosporangium aurantiacum]